MGKWKLRLDDLAIFNEDCVFIGWGGTEEEEAGNILDAHNADCDAYEAQIAELEAELAEAKDDERVASELFEAACNDLGDAQGKLARIAALVSLPGWADIVEAGGRLELTTQRLDAIRAILEEEE
jgi:multidrug resistance efflux pump